MKVSLDELMALYSMSQELPAFGLNHNNVWEKFRVFADSMSETTYDWSKALA
jgi:hypothetical protein